MKAVCLSQSLQHRQVCGRELLEHHCDYYSLYTGAAVAPRNVRATVVSSTVISVQWDGLILNPRRSWVRILLDPDLSVDYQWFDSVTIVTLDLVIMVQCTPPGLTLHLNGYDSIPTDGSGRILITDIGLNDGTTTDDDADALLCQSDVTTEAGNANWYLHPTQLSTAEGDRIQSFDPRGWSRNRGIRSFINRHRLVRLKRHSTITAEEGVFTCNVVGDSNTPISVGIYYPSESVSDT